MSVPIDKDLYKRVKKMADLTYKKPSAYKSGFIVKKYKELGGRYITKKQYENKIKPLERWFKEKWQDIAPLIGERKAYPLYRPMKRITKETPTTFKELPTKRLKQQYKLKQIIKGNKNLPKF
jgi:hypothetical protein